MKYMDLLSEMIAAVQDDLTLGAESSFITPSVIKRALNRAYRKIGSLYKWPDTRDAKKTSTEEGQEYYDYPDNWRPDSIWKLQVDGEDYGDPLAFPDYLYEQENNYPGGNTKVWSNQRRRYFISPVPTADGMLNISVWGFRVVDPIDSDGDVTIFSYNMPEVNEAIVLEAGAILKNKAEVLPARSRGAISGNEMLSVEAGRIASTAWRQIAAENAKYEKTQPGFDVPDFFGSGMSRRREVAKRIGNF